MAEIYKKLYSVMVEKKKRTSLQPDKSEIQTVATSLIPDSTEPGSSPRPESVLNWSNAIFLLQRNKGMLALGTQTDFLTNGGGGLINHYTVGIVDFKTDSIWGLKNF